MTTNEVGAVRSSPQAGGVPPIDLRTRSVSGATHKEVLPNEVSFPGFSATPSADDELGAAARFLLESDGLACCMTCGLVTRPWVVRLPDDGGTRAVVARCVACGTRGTVHTASHWVRVTRAPNPTASIA